MAPGKRQTEQTPSEGGDNVSTENVAITAMFAEIREELKTLNNKINVQSVETETKIQEQASSFDTQISEVRAFTETLISQKVAAIEQQLGNLSGTISNITAALQTLENVASETVVSSLSAQVADLQAQLIELQNARTNSDISSVSARIDTLHTQLAELQNTRGTHDHRSNSSVTEGGNNLVFSTASGETARTNSNANITCSHLMQMTSKPPPSYGGKTPIHPVDFIRDLERYFERHQITEDEKLVVAENCLEGQARIWMNALSATICNFAGFRKSFLRDYWGHQKQNKTRLELHQTKYERRQHGSMVDHFLGMLVKARHLSPPMDDADIIDAIIGHYPREFRQAMRAGNCETVPSALRLLQRMEDDEVQSRASSNNQQPDNKGADDRTAKTDNRARQWQNNNNNNRRFQQRNDEQVNRVNVNVMQVKDGEPGAEQQAGATGRYEGLPISQASRTATSTTVNTPDTVSFRNTDVSAGLGAVSMDYLQRDVPLPAMASTYNTGARPRTGN